MAKNPKKSQTLTEAKDLLFFARREETHPQWYRTILGLSSANSVASAVNRLSRFGEVPQALRSRTEPEVLQ